MEEDAWGELYGCGPTHPHACPLFSFLCVYERYKSMCLCQFTEFCEECFLFCEKSPDVIAHIRRGEERDVNTRGGGL